MVEARDTPPDCGIFTILSTTLTSSPLNWIERHFFTHWKEGGKGNPLLRYCAP